VAKGVSTGPTSLSGTDRLSLYVLLDTLLVLEAALSIAGIDNQGSTWDSSSGTSAGAGVEADADDAGSAPARSQPPILAEELWSCSTVALPNGSRWKAS
jgi:hypothetical protein